MRAILDMLSSPRFAANPRLQLAAENKPPMKWPEKSEAVAIMQQALIELELSLPFTNKFGSADGVFESETVKAVQAFQKQEGVEMEMHNASRIDSCGKALGRNFG